MRRVTFQQIQSCRKTFRKRVIKEIKSLHKFVIQAMKEGYSSCTFLIEEGRDDEWIKKTAYRWYYHNSGLECYWEKMYPESEEDSWEFQVMFKIKENRDGLHIRMR